MRPMILIVEEDPDLAKLFESILRVEGYAVESETNLEGARQSMTARTPDAIVCDWPIQDPSAYLWLNAVRGSQEYRHVPILMVCDELPTRRVRELLWNMGVPTIEKPFDLMEFCRALEGLLPVRERAVGDFVAFR